MSSIKEHMFDLEAQRAEMWVRDHLEDETLDENSFEWQQLEREYYDMLQAAADAAEWQAEIDWLVRNGSSELHHEFTEQLDSLRKMAQSNFNQSNSFDNFSSNKLVINMTYAYAVTLLEAFLGDTLKTLINEHDKFLKNAIFNVEQLKKSRFGLGDLYSQNMTLKTLATKKLSEEVLFHNIPKVMVIFEQVLGKKLSIDYAKVNQIKDVRHDIVHRNGKTIEGEHHHLNFNELLVALGAIEQFAQELQKEINLVVNTA
ncbi:hypothetical protein ACPD0R_003528 [Vibrio cholerae]